MALADKKSLLKPKVSPPTGVSSGNFNFGTTRTQIDTSMLSQAPIVSAPYVGPSAGGDQGFLQGATLILNYY
jgi:hypothetical protein